MNVTYLLTPVPPQPADTCDRADWCALDDQHPGACQGRAYGTTNEPDTEAQGEA